MDRFFLLAWASLALVAVAAAGASARTSEGSSPTGASSQGATGYIVVFHENVEVAAKLASLSERMSLEPEFVYEHALRGFAASLTPAQADALWTDADVKFLSLDGVAQGAGVQPIAPGEIVPPGIERVESAVPHPPTQIQLKGKQIAVLDTGIDLNHADLNAVHGKDCVNAPPAQDDHGHGTHVAGTAAAKNQGAVVAGVSPGTKVWAVKVLASNNFGTWAQIICGIDWVTANAASIGDVGDVGDVGDERTDRRRPKIKVANMSLGGSGSDDQNCGNTNFDAVHQAICNSVAAGVTYVVAAHNQTKDFATLIPAAYNEVLTVTAMTDTDGRPGALGPPAGCFVGNPDDRYASFSNFANPSTNDVNHTVAGPGTCVLSDRLGGGTTIFSGTSMATPHVAATVANCIGHAGAPGPCAGMTPAQIIAKIRADAAAKPAAYGFSGDPNHAPLPGRYYGFLVSNLGY